MLPPPGDPQSSPQGQAGQATGEWGFFSLRDTAEPRARTCAPRCGLYRTPRDGPRFLLPEGFPMEVAARKTGPTGTRLWTGTQRLRPRFWWLVNLWA